VCSVLKVALSYILWYEVCADFVCIVLPSNRLMDLMNRPFKAQWLLCNTCRQDFMVMEFRRVSYVKRFKSTMLESLPCLHHQGSDVRTFRTLMMHTRVDHWNITWLEPPDIVSLQRFYYVFLLHINTYYIFTYNFQVKKNYFSKQH